MKKIFNKALLSGATVVGEALQYPRRVNVLVGKDINGYERGDLADINAIIDIALEVVDQSDHKEVKEVEKALQREIRDRQVEDISMAKSILNYAVEVKQSTLPDSLVFTIKQGGNVVGIINVPRQNTDVINDISNISHLDRSAGTLDIIDKINLLIERLQEHGLIAEDPESQI